MKTDPYYDKDGLDELLKQYNDLRNGVASRFLEEESFEKIIEYYDEQDEFSKALEAAGIVRELHIFKLSIGVLPFGWRQVDQVFLVTILFQMVMVFLLPSSIVAWVPSGLTISLLTIFPLINTALVAPSRKSAFLGLSEPVLITMS